MNDRVEQPRSPSLGWREVLVHALLLLVLLAAVFPGVFLHGELALPGGWLTTVKPWSEHMPPEAEAPKNWLTNEVFVFFTKTYFVTQEALEAGEWPLWNKYEMMGMPQLANYQSTPFYPPRLLHTFLDVYVATSLLILLKLWLCGMNAYLCGRGIGLGQTSSRFFSVAWMLSGFNLMWTYWPEPDIAAWTPLLLLGVEWLAQERWRRGFVVLTFAATLLMLAGHPENALSMSMGAGLYFFLRLFWLRKRARALWKAIGLAAAAWAIALLVSAPLVLPFLEYLINSHTVGLRDKSALDKHFIPFGGLLAFWAPRFYGTTAEGNYWAQVDPRYLNSMFVMMLYPGLAVWLGIASLFARGRSRFRHAAACVAVPWLFHILMTLDLPLIRIVQELPLLKAMWRCWYVSFSMFAFALLGAMGVEHWLGQKRPFKALTPHLVLTATVASVVLAVLSMNRPLMRQLGMLPYVYYQVLIGLLFALAGLVLFAAAGRFHRYRRWWGFALTLLLAVDLLYAARGLHPTAPRSWIFPETRVTSYLKGLDEPPRVAALTAGINPGLLAQCGIEQLWGYDGIYPQRSIEFLGRLGIPTAEAALAMEPVCGLTHYLHDPEQPARMPFDDPQRFRLVLEADGLEVYENLRAFPRAFLVNHVEIIENRDEMFEIMADPAFEPAKTCLLEKPLPGPFPGGRGAPEGKADVLKRSNNEEVVEVSAEQDSILVLTDTYYPGWYAWIDGIPAEVFPAYAMFRAVRVPEGGHTIVFRFQPWSFRIGVTLSAVTLVVAFFWGLRQLRRIGKGERRLS